MSTKAPSARLDPTPASGVETILDAADPRLAAFRDIRERDLIGRQGLFIAESAGVVRTLLARSRFKAEALLVSQAQARAKPDLIALAAARATPVYVADRSVLEAVAGFDVHRGVLAIGRRGEALAPESLLATAPPRAVILGLIGVSNADNVGALFRNAEAFAAHAVLLDRGSCDPLYRKAIRVSTGSSLKLAFATAPSPEDLLDALARSGFQTFALSPRGEAALGALDGVDRLALIVGAEGQGLPDPVLARCRGVRVAMAPGVDSLNVATAAGIALHAAYLRA